MSKKQVGEIKILGIVSVLLILLVLHIYGNFFAQKSTVTQIGVLTMPRVCSSALNMVKSYTPNKYPLAEMDYVILGGYNNEKNSDVQYTAEIFDISTKEAKVLSKNDAIKIDLRDANATKIGDLLEQQRPPETFPIEKAYENRGEPLEYITIDKNNTKRPIQVKVDGNIRYVKMPIFLRGYKIEGIIPRSSVSCYFIFTKRNNGYIAEYSYGYKKLKVLAKFKTQCKNRAYLDITYNIKNPTLDIKFIFLAIGGIKSANENNINGFKCGDKLPDNAEICNGIDIVEVTLRKEKKNAYYKKYQNIKRK